MQTFNIGKYKVVLKEHDNNKTDNSMYENVIDFGCEDNKTIVVQVLCGTESRNVAYLVPFYTQVEHFAVPSDNKLFMMFNDILCIFNPETCKIEQKNELETNWKRWGRCFRHLLMKMILSFMEKLKYTGLIKILTFYGSFPEKTYS